MTGDAPKSLDLPASGEFFGESVERELSRPSVPVARNKFLSVEGEALRLGDNQNLLAGRAAPTQINKVWVGDITDIPLVTQTSSGRFDDLGLLMDLYSRRIVCWEYGTSMSEELVLGALRRAIRDRQPSVGLIHRADRGGQYAARRYRDVLRRSAMQQSMSAAESCYDNAFMESCFRTVKTELELVEYTNSSEAVRELFNDIRYYNGSRRLSSL